MTVNESIKECVLKHKPKLEDHSNPIVKLIVSSQVFKSLKRIWRTSNAHP